MNEIYWLTVLGNLHGIVAMIFATLIFVCILAFLFYIFSENDTPGETKAFSRFFKKLLLITICTSIIFCFLPSKQDLLAIYGIGGTIDYIKCNDKEKELPDNVVDALTEYLEHVNNDKNKED